MPNGPDAAGPLSPRARTAVFLLGLCALLNIYSTQPLLPDLARDLHVPVERATWTITATTLGVALLAPFAGSVSDFLGRKRVMVAAIGASLAATLACALARDFTTMLVCRFAQGLFIPFVFAVAVAYVAEECTGPAAQGANALYVSGTAFGGFCGRFLSGAVTTQFGWRSSFLAMALVLLVTLVVTAAWLPRERRFRRSESLLASLRGIGRHFGNARLLGTCFIGAAILFLQVGSFTYAGMLLEAAPFGLSTFEIGAVFAVFLVAVVVTPLTGRLIGRIGRRRTFVLVSVVSLAGLALTLVPSTPAVILGLAASSTGVFSGQACAIGYAAEAGGPARSSAVGLYLTSYYAGGSIGAVAPSPLYTAAGWGATVGLLAAVVGLSVLVALAAWPAPASRPLRIKEPAL
ncbi:MFS transporter [Kitasatospora sp. NPDC089509]|uniref:MFS transporter n=1 Tax=Kitasatospora sp. NPDC089509 TaxID=3364079 RepID=UPI00380921FF